MNPLNAFVALVELVSVFCSLLFELNCDQLETGAEDTSSLVGRATLKSFRCLLNVLGQFLGPGDPGAVLEVAHFIFSKYEFMAGHQQHLVSCFAGDPGPGTQGLGPRAHEWSRVSMFCILQAP